MDLQNLAIKRCILCTQNAPLYSFFSQIGSQFCLQTISNLRAQNDWAGYPKLDHSGYLRQRSDLINYMITLSYH